MVYSIQQFSIEDIDDAQDINLAELINKVYLIVDSQFPDKTIQWNVSVDKTFQLFGSFKHFEQMLIPLISNAVESLENSGDITILVQRSEFENVSGEVVDCFEIMIQDNGSGISPNIIDQIFEPFFSSKSDQVGLGLNFAQQVISDYGGKIKVRSPLGMGVRVKISLPLHQPDEVLSVRTADELMNHVYS